MSHYRFSDNKVPELLVTLWPSFPHFRHFCDDERLSGIRLNSAMIMSEELKKELALLQEFPTTVPLYFDIKGRQLRVTKVFPHADFLDLELNHPISVETPTEVVFKGGVDRAFLEHVEGGRRLIFRGGPEYLVYPGESLHVRHPSLVVHGPTFVEAELEKIAQTRAAGFTRYFLSYVESQADVEQFLDLVGRECQVMLKIENKKGLQYVAHEFVKKPNLTLVAARGDLYVELDKPHDILAALQLIIEKDKEACVGSRLLLSLFRETLPSCADLCDLAWLSAIGYRSFMLCDELCLQGDRLENAIIDFSVFGKECCHSHS